MGKPIDDPNDELYVVCLLYHPSIRDVLNTIAPRKTFKARSSSKFVLVATAGGQSKRFVYSIISIFNNKFNKNLFHW